MTNATEADIFRAFLEASTDAIVVIDRENRYVYVSRSAAEYLGRTQEELIGRTWRDLGLDERVFAPAAAQRQRVLETGERITMETVLDTPRGRREFQYVMFPVGPHVGVISRDVTDQRNATRAVASVVERYRGFVENSSEAIWRFEIDEPIDITLPEERQVELMFERAYLAECNQAMAEMYGYSRPDEIIGARVSQMLDPQEEQNHEYLRAFIRAGYTLREAESVESDRFGNRKYFVNSLTGIVEDGGLRRAWGVQRDVTEQKESNARLRMSEERLQALVEASTETVWTAVGEGELTWVGASWSEATGQTLDEAVGHGWLQMVHPEDRELSAIPFWRAAVRNQTKMEGTLRIRQRDGSYRWNHIRAVPLRNEDGTIREWICANTDVDSEHRQTSALAGRRARAELLAAANDLFLQSLNVEETLRNLARMVVPLLADWCAIDMLEPDGSLRRITVEHSDPEMVRFAYELAQKFPPDRDAPRGAYAVARTGRTDWMPEVSAELLQQSARSPEHLELIRRANIHGWISTPIRVRDGVAGVLTLVSSDAMRRFDETDVQLATDLATRAGHAIENARLYQQAIEANRAKDEFLATLSHELRTPLTSILGWANLLRMTNLDRETFEQATRQIEDSARVQAALIDDLLDVSRVITGKLQLDIRMTDATPVIQSAIAAVQPAASAKHIEIATDIPTSLSIRADPNRVRQIVWNLLSNAVKFSGENTRIDVSVQHEGDDIVIRVSDQGIGIAPEVLPRVFERFWQADASSHRLQGGLGLGLAIVRHLAELHGGSATAESEGLGKGARFTVRLPA